MFGVSQWSQHYTVRMCPGSEVSAGKARPAKGLVMEATQLPRSEPEDFLSKRLSKNNGIRHGPVRMTVWSESGGLQQIVCNPPPVVVPRPDPVPVHVGDLNKAMANVFKHPTLPPAVNNCCKLTSVMTVSLFYFLLWPILGWCGVTGGRSAWRWPAALIFEF